VAAELLGTRGIQLVAVRAELARPEPKLSLPRSQQEPAVLAEFSLNLTEAALEGQLDPLIGRDAQLDQIFQILSRRTDHNAVLIGPPGVGKKTIVAGNDAITAAVHFAGKLLPGFLPGKAVSLLDESGTHINHKPLPEEIRTLQKHIRFIIQRMQAAIANHEFEKARFYSDEERKERDKLKLEVEKYGLGDPEQQIITRDHIEATVSRMTGLSLDTIKKLCPSDSQS
jgi:ATP-dependent Clp protease ATP-binding subunit ClpA